MADARLLHKRGIHGERIIALDHLEFRVWVQYVLSADDYGVMRASATVLRADNVRLEREPIRRIHEAMRQLEQHDLVQVFEHQGVKFWWQCDWQDFQGIRYPRETVNPAPPELTLLGSATEKTRALFGLRGKASRERLRNVSVTSPIPARAGGRETQTLTLTANTSGSGSSEESARETTPREPLESLVNGTELRRHASQHAWCDWKRKMCVPYGLHDELVGRLSRPDADEKLRAWYPTVIDRYGDQPIGDSVFEFWRNEFAAKVGTVTKKPASASGKGNQSMDAMQRAIERRVGSQEAR